MHQVKQSLEKLEHLGGNHEDLIEACVCESDCSFVTSIGASGWKMCQQEPPREFKRLETAISTGCELNSDSLEFTSHRFCSGCVAAHSRPRSGCERRPSRGARTM